MALPADQILFLLASDCFRTALFPTFPQRDLDEAGAIAQALIEDMLGGGDNYYLHASFSENRARRTRELFFKRLEERRVSGRLRNRIALLIRAMPRASRNMTNACDVISSICGYLFWLESNALHTPLAPDLVAVIADVEPLGLERALPCVDWGEKWLGSTSARDRYIMALMDGIDDAQVHVFEHLQTLSARFDFLSLWMAELGEARFAQIRRFIETEARLRPDARDPDTAAQIGMILAAV